MGCIGSTGGFSVPGRLWVRGTTFWFAVHSSICSFITGGATVEFFVGFLGWLRTSEATHAINAHRSDRGGGNVARLSRQPSHSNAVVRGHYQGRFLFLQLHSANLRNVRAGGDRRQPRILRSESVLPRARTRSVQG